MDSSPYDRIEIIVAGLEKLTARPTAFEYDSLGNPTLATEFETTCPSCGSVVNFLVGDIIKRGDKDHVNCPHCQLNYYDEFEKKSIISVRMGGQDMKVAETKPVVICPFIDPIEVGIFDPLKISGFKVEVKEEVKEDVVEDVVEEAEEAEEAEAEEGVDDEIRELING